MNVESTDEADLALVRRWHAEWSETKRAIETAQLRAAGLRKMIDGMLELHPEFGELPVKTDADAYAPRDFSQVQAQTSSATPPNAADVVRRILRANPERWWTSGAMVKAVHMEGVSATPTAIRLALRRTGERGYSEKSGDGKGQIFRFRSDPDEMDASEGATE